MAHKKFKINNYMDQIIMDYFCPHNEDDDADTNRAYKHFDDIVQLFESVPQASQDSAIESIEMLMDTTKYHQVTQNSLCYFMFKYHCENANFLRKSDAEFFNTLDDLYGFNETYKALTQVEYHYYNHSEENAFKPEEYNADIMDLFRIETLLDIQHDLEDFKQGMCRNNVLQSLDNLFLLGESDNSNIQQYIQTFQDSFFDMLGQIQKEEQASASANTKLPTPSGP